MTREEIIKPENLVYKKPTLMNDNPMHYCPGCSHGVVHKLIAEVIEEMGMENKAVLGRPDSAPHGEHQAPRAPGWGFQPRTHRG